MSRRVVGRAVVVTCVLAALAIVIAAVHRLSEAEDAARAQRAEIERTRQALLRAAAAAEQAMIATTPPEERQARKDAALTEFQAAEAEMLMQQTRARRAREARLAEAARQGNQGLAVDGPRP